MRADVGIRSNWKIVPVIRKNNETRVNEDFSSIEKEYERVCQRARKRELGTTLTGHVIGFSRLKDFSDSPANRYESGEVD